MLLSINASYALNSQSLYWVSNRSGSFEIWRQFDGQSQQLTNIQANSLGRPILSPSQEKLAFTNKIDLTNELTIMDVASQEISLRHALPPASFLIAWSSDNQRLYYSTYDKGQYVLHVFDTDKHQSSTIALGAGAYIKEELEQESLVYVDIVNKRLVRKDKRG